MQPLIKKTGEKKNTKRIGNDLKSQKQRTDARIFTELRVGILKLCPIENHLHSPAQFPSEMEVYHSERIINARKLGKTTVHLFEFGEKRIGAADGSH